MATLLECYNARVANSDLRNKTEAAISVLLWTIFAEDPGTTDHAQICILWIKSRGNHV
jgi:hypothetical protein